MNTEEMLKKEATRLRMAKLRAKRKPPKLTNVHHTVKALPDDNTLSYVSVKNGYQHKSQSLRLLE